MAAVIRPIGIQHTDFRHGRVSVLFLLKIVLDMLKILKSHCQPQVFIKSAELILFHILKAVKDNNVLWLFIICYQCIRFVHRCFSGIYRVDAIGFYLLKFFLRNLTHDQIGDRRLYDRFLILLEKLYALHSGICPLVELPRQKFHTEYFAVRRNLDRFPVKNVHRGF